MRSAADGQDGVGDLHVVTVQEIVAVIGQGLAQVGREPAVPECRPRVGQGIEHAGEHPTEPAARRVAGGHLDGADGQPRDPLLQLGSGARLCRPLDGRDERHRVHLADVLEELEGADPATRVLGVRDAHGDERDLHTERPRERLAISQT